MSLKTRCLATMVACLLSLTARVHAECLPDPTPPSAEIMQQLVEKAEDRGFLWKISKGGQSSWLYGTIHVNRLDGFVLGPKTRAALQSSNVIALELDLSDEKTTQDTARLMREGVSPIPAAFLPRIEAQLQQNCLPLEVTKHVPATLLFSVLMMMEARKDGVEAAFGTEHFLLGAAQARGEKIVALETVAEQLAGLIGPEAQMTPAQYELMLSQLESGAARKQVLQLLDVWNRSDFALMSRFEEWCGCMDTPEDRRMMKRMNDDRNQLIAKRIAKLHRADQSVFVAVGSLHMTGKKGLPTLLRQQGFKVERVDFAKSTAAQ